jgi:acetylornithine deacetylase
MNIFELTRSFIDIDSVTPNEEAFGNCLLDHLSRIAAATGGRVEKMEVEPHRFNVLATWDQPVVTLSTHIDTVPPFFASSEDGEFIWGRGACDTKGIIASMLTALEGLLTEGERKVAMLFLVDEECDSAGATEASKHPIGSKFIINGEPTDNRLALGSKGAMRYEAVASGRMAHSAYPHLGESAIEKLLDALERVRRMPLAHDELFGPSTLNIGTIQGGRAANVIPDSAKAQLFFRLVDDGSSVRAGMDALRDGACELNEVRCTPAMKFKTVDGFDTFVASFTTDIPAFKGTWGEPLLIGPGSVHVAHTDKECVAKRELIEAVEIYKNLVTRLIHE